ncbi:MAG: M13 family metallopeptidase [Pseudomonadales bacterium]|nr:M13 family metallopeptidase [Pseudomonadales bacterium]
MPTLAAFSKHFSTPPTILSFCRKPFGLWFIVLFISACTSTERSSDTTANQPRPKPVFGSWGVDLAARDQSIKPGEDFFNYANGAWLARHKIPPERSSYGLSLIVHEKAQQRVKAIIEEFGASSGPKGSSAQQIGDYYASWMNTKTLNELGITPLLPDLKRIAAISNITELTVEFGKFHYTAGISPIAQSLGIDPADPDKYSIDIALGGLGLPDRDYYLEQSEQFQRFRLAYKKHISQMLRFAQFDYTVETADEKADAIIQLETQIATYQWLRSDRRDRDKTYNPTTVTALSQLHAKFDWKLFLAAGHITNLHEINIAHPNTIQPLIDLIYSTPLSIWKDYLHYHLISNNASLLSEPIDNANFEFWGKVLSGRQQQLLRWQRGVSRVGAKNGLGEALGQIYVQRHFPESSKLQMQQLVENLRKAYAERIDAISWMGETTKKEAHAKLAAFKAKIGYPDHWLDISKIHIEKDNLFHNARAVRRFFEDFDTARLQGPTDREEWFMMPQTVNAYYLSNFNEIVFPAAILEPPFFDPNADAAVNYASIGAVIGHEMGHGFDDQGSKSDARGIKRNWWTDEDRTAFDSRTSKLAEQYSRFEPVPGNFIDGNFTLGENIGDLGGVAVAHRAYQLSLNGAPPNSINGYSADQRFFLAYAQSWRSKTRDQATLQYLKSDPHSPAAFRVNGVVRNIDAWYSAFDIKAGDALYLTPANRVSIW